MMHCSVNKLFTETYLIKGALKLNIRNRKHYSLWVTASTPCQTKHKIQHNESPWVYRAY